MARCIRIGNAAGFWGDAIDAPARLVRQTPNLDYLTLDYLAEVSMSILAKQRKRDASKGYPRDFIDVMSQLAPLWKDGRRYRVITNAGGLNPHGCAQACAEVLRQAGCGKMKIGIVSGDDVLPLLQADAGDGFPHLESDQPIRTVSKSLSTANAYLGAEPIARALRGGADIVITGRVADPSLTVGPCQFEFGWEAGDYQRLAGATVAGHLIECGTQVTGGISTDWLEMPDPAHLGYPIAEVYGDGSCVITKPAGTGGRVTARTVKEQLVYEIGDPARYLSPDATVSLLSLLVDDQGGHRVRVTGAAGAPPPGSYKVSATYHAGYRATGMLTIFGRDAVAKARRCGEIVLKQLEESAGRPQKALAECLGAGDAAPGADANPHAMEVVLRISVLDERRELVEKFTRLLTPLITAGPQGVTGYADLGRPEVREVFGYWPTLIERTRVTPQVDWMDV